MSKVVVKGGLGFPAVLFLVLLVCKLFGASISWWWVFCPFWIPLVTIAAFFIIALVVGIFKHW
jgi:hypothetical protein